MSFIAPIVTGCEPVLRHAYSIAHMQKIYSRRDRSPVWKSLPRATRGEVERNFQKISGKNDGKLQSVNNF